MIKTFILVSFLISFSYSQIYVEKNSGVNTRLNSVSAAIGIGVWICGDSGVVLRKQNEFFENANSEIPASVNLYTIWAINDVSALVAGMQGSVARLWRTTNAGLNWHQVHQQPNGFFNGLVMRNNAPLVGFLQGNPVGGRWSLWKTTNGGLNWDSSGCYLQQNNSESGWKNSIFLGSSSAFWLPANDSALWFGTNNSRIYYSTNFAASWSVQSTTPEINTTSIGFLVQEGFAGGSSLVKTENYGLNWVSVSTPGSGKVSGIVVIPPGVLDYGYSWFTKDSSSTIFRTLYPGGPWQAEYTAAGGNYIHYSKVRGGITCYGVRSNGGITQCNYFLAAIENIGSGTPSSFSLSQNYPNPFNPTTNFEFSIADFGLVRLTVFDAIGREVEVLVNEQLQPGTYEVSWDATDYPSGVYYYRLESGSFTQTRKMVLIR